MDVQKFELCEGPVESIEFPPGSVPVHIAAKVYGRDSCWVRAGILCKWLPIGIATRDNKPVPPRIISLKVNNSDISRLRDARDTIAVGQQGQVLYLLVEP